MSEQELYFAEQVLAMDMSPLEGEWTGPDTEALRAAYDVVVAAGGAL